MPSSLQWNQALYLRHCQPEVVRLMIRYLEKDELSLARFDIDDEPCHDAFQICDPAFYVRVYKLAGSLACVANY